MISEKLSALDAVALIRVLPQIIAVVEAADNDETCGCCRRPTWRHASDCPLVVLDKVLGGPSSVT